jgi:hypothetical protein
MNNTSYAARTSSLTGNAALRTYDDAANGPLAKVVKPAF